MSPIVEAVLTVVLTIITATLGFLSLYFEMRN